MPPRAALTATEQDAWRAFVLAAMQVTERLGRHLQSDFDLSMDDYGILTVLAESPDGELRFTDIARTLRMPKANVTYRFQRMERRELVSRRACASDARGAFAVLTPQGRSVIQLAEAPHLRLVRQLFIDPIEPDALPTLSEQLRRVLDGLESEHP